MALTIGFVGVDESSKPGRKDLQLRGDVFAVKREVFAVGEMSVPARRLLRKRLASELDAVRDLLKKAESYSCGDGGAGKDGRVLAPQAPVEVDGCRAAKSKKVSPLAELPGESKREPADRERLAGRLAAIAEVLPDHVVAFLQNPRLGDADSRGNDGEIEMGVQSMKDGVLFQLKMLLDKFAPESAPKSQGGRAPLPASGISCLSKHQEAGDKMAPVQEEEVVDICGGVSRVAIRDIAEEYGELVDDIGVQVLSPLQRKYVDLAERDEYVDICGDASPVVFSAKAGDRSSHPSLSSSDSDASSSDSDSSSSSGSDKEGHPYKSVGSRPPPAFLLKEALPISGPLELQDKCAPPENDSYKKPPAPEALPKENDRRSFGCPYRQPPEPAPEAMQMAEPENQCALTAFPITTSPAAPTVLPKGRGTLAQPLEQATKGVQIADPEELQEGRVAPAATVHPITGSAPPPSVLPNENGASSQPAPVPPPVAAQVAAPPPQPQELQNEGAQHATNNKMNDLIAIARQKERMRAMAKARQVLLEMERAALPDQRIHPLDMELLGITAFEHVVSTVQDARTAQCQVNDGVGLHISPGHPSILQQLGLFLKADDGGEEEQPPPLAVASDGEDMEIEDGEIQIP